MLESDGPTTHAVVGPFRFRTRLSRRERTSSPLPIDPRYVI